MFKKLLVLLIILIVPIILHLNTDSSKPIPVKIQELLQDPNNFSDELVTTSGKLVAKTALVAGAYLISDRNSRYILVKTKKPFPQNSDQEIVITGRVKKILEIENSPLVLIEEEE